MKTSLIAGAVACAFSPAFAEDISTFDLGTIVVTPARAPQALGATLQSTTVIGADDIARAGQQTLPELLQSRGGVEIGTSGGPGQQSSVFIRGANSSHTVVLVDGVRMDNITAGTTAIEHIPLDQIARIEILRGPGSSLYGADAIGGVIQIFTRKPAGSGFDVTAGAGTWNTFKGSAGFWHRLGDTQIDVRVGHESADAFSATNGREPYGNNNPDRDPYRNTSVTASLSHQIDAGNSVGISAFAAEGTAHFDAGTPGDPVKTEKLQSVSAYSRNRINDSWESLLRVAQGVDDYRWANISYKPVKSTQDQITWQNDVNAGGGTLSAGLEYVAQKLSTPTAYDQTSRHVASAFGLYRTEIGAHSLQASARHDDNSQFGGHDTGNIAYGYRLSPAWRVSANVGTAFRAPSFADLYYPGYANPDLQPESSTGGELALSYAEQGRTASATWFSNRIDDLIAFDWAVTKPTCPSGCPVNVKRAKTEGLELAAGTPLGAGFDLTARATLQQAVDADTGRRLARRAESYGSAGVNWRQGAWRLGSELVASGDRFDSSNESPSSRLPGYAYVNLLADYAVSKSLGLFARWNNVFDRQYELVRGYDTPDSNVFAGFRYQMK